MQKSRIRVEEILTETGQKRYVVTDQEGEFVTPVTNYLRYLDSIGRSRNTLRAYAYDLALYFEFLGVRETDYLTITVDDMGKFVEWLKEPQGNEWVMVLPIISPRKDDTVNRALTAVSGFYDHLWHQDGLEVGPRMSVEKPAHRRPFKSFLHHLSQGQTFQSNLVRQPWTRSGRPPTLTNEEIERLVWAAPNERDKLLIALLFESGMRIGEALALWMEDIEKFDGTITIRDRGELVNGAEIKTPASARIVDLSDDMIDRLVYYVGTAHRSGVKTNHVFVKLRGPQAGQPLSYAEVNDLFQRLKKKTGIDANAHMLRHSMATRFSEDGWRPEELQKRLGHAQFQTTMNLYVHADEKRIRDAFQRSQDKVRLRLQSGNSPEHPGGPPPDIPPFADADTTEQGASSGEGDAK